MTLFRRSASQRARSQAAPQKRRLFAMPSRETMALVGPVLVQVIGESVKGRVTRAALLAGVAFATNYAMTEPETPVMAMPPAQVAPAPVQVEHVPP